MRFFRFLSGRASYVIGLIAALGLGFALGDAALQRAPEAQPQPTAQSEPVGQIGEISVLPTTKVVWTYFFTLCGEEYTSDTPPDITGLTREDILKKYPGAQVLGMTREEVKVQTRVDKYCPEHYVLMQTEQDVSVFKTNPATLEAERVMRLTIDADALDEAAQAALAGGIPFDTLEQIDAYLEDAES